MDAQLKADWIKALRSGNYVQGQGRLRTRGNKYCCLGVLCDIVNPEGWVDGSDFYYRDSNGSGEEYNPPYEMTINTLGEVESAFDSSSRPNSSGLIEGLYEPNGKRVTLVTLNDDGLTFDQIADMIDYFF